MFPRPSRPGRHNRGGAQVRGVYRARAASGKVRMGEAPRASWDAYRLPAQASHSGWGIRPVKGVGSLARRRRGRGGSRGLRPTGCVAHPDMAKQAEPGESDQEALGKQRIGCHGGVPFPWRAIRGSSPMCPPAFSVVTRYTTEFLTIRHDPTSHENRIYNQPKKRLTSMRK